PICSQTGSILCPICAAKDWSFGVMATKRSGVVPRLEISHNTAETIMIGKPARCRYENPRAHVIFRMGFSRGLRYAGSSIARRDGVRYFKKMRDANPATRAPDSRLEM